MSESAAESSVAPATGESVSGTGYSFSAPEGWTVPGDLGAEFEGLDSIAANSQDADGFADNVNVVLSPAGALSAGDIEEASSAELTAAGATDVVTQDRIQVAGSEAAHLTATLSSQGADYVIEQYYVTNDDQTYVVTFSFTVTVPEGERTALAESVLATWSWE